MMEGDDGVVIVDVSESVEAGRAILAEFRRITSKPIKAIIYTHFHADHCYGTEAFIEDPENPPMIVAHQKFDENLRNFILQASGAAFRRAMRQFGTLVPDDVKRGTIGSYLKWRDEGFTMGLLLPTHVQVESHQELMIAGIQLQLIHMPGETPDHLCVYLPKRSVLIPGDNIYKAFPNLYAIRGSPVRDYQKWINSLDGMIKLKPEILVPCHTRPVYGQDEIHDLLTIYRDAIQYVHDQTLRHMNEGLNINDIVPLVKLPPQLARHPYLQPLYGTVPWSVRGLFTNHIGWFGGDPVNLNPMDKHSHARSLVDLAGSSSATLDAAKLALLQRQPQWTLELSTAILQIEPKNYRAMKLRIDALKELAESQSSSNGRNYYHSCAYEESETTKKTSRAQGKEWVIQNFPVLDLFDALRYKLKAEKCYDSDEAYNFSFPDIQKKICVHIRHGIAEVTSKTSQTPKLTVTCNTAIWRKLLLKQTTVMAEIQNGTLVIGGSPTDLRVFFTLFDTDD